MLSIRNVSKQFEGLTALKNVNLDIKEGFVYGIIGPNGSGKTTLFNCITGLHQINSGNIYLDEFEITNIKPNKISNLGIKRTFQQGRLVPSMTVLQNVMAGVYDFSVKGIVSTFLKKPFAKSEIEKEVEKKSIKMLDILGLDRLTNKYASDLVWVERQYVQIARAMVSKPKILLLDEPASGMGNSEKEEMARIITKIKNMGVTPVVVSHNMSLLIKVVDIVMVLNFGEKIFEGEPQNINKNQKVMEAYLGTD